jgi:integrase/recombinase XerC
MTVGPLKDFMGHLQAERHVSRYTVRNYSRDIGEFLSFIQQRGVISTEAATRELVREYLVWLSQRGIVRASIARKLSALRTFYRYLKQEGRVENNPMSLISSPKKERRLPNFLSNEEMGRLVETPDTATPQGMRDRAILEMLYAAGTRVSELAGLDMEEVNLPLREIRVWGKGGKERVVLLGAPAVRALEEYLLHGRPGTASKSPALFVNHCGKRLTVRQVQRLVKGYALKAGLEKRVHPHLVRHTFATHLLDGGADLRVVQELLGHTSLTSTQVYTHVSQAHARKVYMQAHPRAKEAEQDG